MIVNKELDGQGFVKQKKPYPDHRYIDDTTSWIYIVKTSIIDTYVKGVKHKVKRPELRRTSNKMSSPNRASRLQYYHIVVFVRGRGKGEREKE